MDKNIIDELRQRIDELEEQVSFQDKTVEDLNAAISSQELDILEMKKLIKLLATEIEQLQQSDPIKPSSEETPPPHY